MKLVGIIFKVVVAIAVMMLLGFEGGFGWGSVFFFGVVYGLVTYYIWFIREHGLTVFHGHIILFVLSLLLPLFILILPYYVLNAVLPGESGMYVGGIIYIALCFGCVANDVIAVIRTFNPSFLEGVDLGAPIKRIFEKKEK